MAGRSLVSTVWLAQELRALSRGIKVVDASLYLPSANRNARNEYLSRHLPGAGFFDIDEVADHSTDLPHMLPPAAVFSKSEPLLSLFSLYDAVLIHLL
jgi:thiosulfate/3-mercaptopyruvate sulfurtransferase